METLSLPQSPLATIGWLPRPCSYLKTYLLSLAKERGKRVEFVDTSGGPGAGKTSIQLRLEFEFTQLGWFVSVLPEAATIIRNMGFRAEEGRIDNAIAQLMIMDLNQHLRMQALAAAIDTQGVDKILIIGDRSDFDCIPYLTSPRSFPDVLAARGVNMGDIAHNVHHVFMRSLAVDDPALYEEICRGNRARKETTAAEAVETDERTLAGIRSFVNPIVIDNKGEGGFEAKMQRAVNAIRQMLDEATVQRQSAFMVTSEHEALLHELGLSADRSTRIEQFYTQQGVRYRMTEYPGGHRVFDVTSKTDGGKPGYRFALNERIHPDVYHKAFEQRDGSRKVLSKRRYGGVCAGSETANPSGTFVAVDVFDAGLFAPNINRVEIHHSTDDRSLPLVFARFPYEEVTDNEAFSNLAIAEGRCPAAL